MSKQVVVVDPGHGGVDPGAESHGVKEKDLTLAYGLELKTLLEGRSVTCILTRRSDNLPGGAEDKDEGLRNRYSLANEVMAACFVSLHFNASDSKKAKGLEVFYAEGSDRGKALATQVYQRATHDAHATRVYPDRSPQCGNRRLAVLRGTHMPAILIEFAYLTNDVDRENAESAAWRRARLLDVTDGIMAWLRTQS